MSPGARARPAFSWVCFDDPNGIAAVYEGIALWQRLSAFDLEILNLWLTRGDWVRLPLSLDLTEYDGIIIHPAVSYTFGNLARSTPAWRGASTSTTASRPDEAGRAAHERALR